MAKARYARFKFQRRRNNLICTGQKRTRTGQFYPYRFVEVPLLDWTAETLKWAMQQGIDELNKDAVTS